MTAPAHDLVIPDMLTAFYRPSGLGGGPPLLLCVCANDKQAQRVIDAHKGETLLRIDYIQIPSTIQ